jgi:hypothetical protein
MAAVEKYLDPAVDESDMLRTFRVVHAALLRTDTDGVPIDFDSFVDLVDDLTPLDEAVGAPDPTHAPG